MTGHITRRSFLGRTIATSSVAAAGLAGGTLLPPAVANDPVQREVAGTKYKLTLAGYSYRKLLTGQNPVCSLENFVQDCARFGLEGTEPTSYYFPQPVTEAYLCQLKALAFRLGLSISSTAVGNNFCLPAGQERDQQIALVKQWIDYAAVLGAPVIRIFSGSVAEGQTVAQAQKLAISAIEECCDYAETRGILLGLENHGGLTSTADGMLELIRAVRHPWFGVWMDTGNFHSPDIYGELEKIAPYTLHVQVKVVISPEGQGRQETDYQRLAQILEDVGYRGWVCLEYEEDEDPRTACPKYLAKLREVFV